MNSKKLNDKLNRKVLLTAAALLLNLSVGNLQAADDAKIYPGTMCRPMATGDGGYTPYVYYNNDGSISNTSEQFSVTVDCPIIRDNTVNKDGLESIILYYDDKNTSYNFFCTAQSRWIWGNTIHKTFNGTPVQNYGISYLHILGLDSSRGANTFYTMRCVIPKKVPGQPSSRLLNYKVTEGDSTWGT